MKKEKISVKIWVLNFKLTSFVGWVNQSGVLILKRKPN